MTEQKEGPLSETVLDEICAHPNLGTMALEMLNQKIRDLYNGTAHFEDRHGAVGQYLAISFELAAESLQRDYRRLRAAIDKRKE